VHGLQLIFVTRFVARSAHIPSQSIQLIAVCLRAGTALTRAAAN
jgi:hypothetical protein